MVNPRALKSYSVSSPTRIDLAGGTLDLWPLWAFMGLQSGKTCTLNISISIQTHATLTERADEKIELDIQDLKFKRTFLNLENLLADQAPELRLIKAHLEYWQPARGFKLATRSESPVGGGLGGSSSLSITLIKVLKTWLGKTLSDQQMVTLAQNLEACVLHVPTGVQDYYPAVEGGLHIVEFSPLGVSWRRLTIDESVFKSRSFLVYTGKPHQSGINNWQVLKESVEKRSGTEEALLGLRKVAGDMRDVCENQDWSRMAAVLQEEYRFRLKLSPVFSSPEIQRLNTIALESGAEAIKICGAGGGGCVWVWTAENKRDAAMAAVEKAGFQILKDVTLVKEAQAVREHDAEKS